MFTLASGLRISLFILEFLRNNENLKDISIDVGTFTNSRESGLTFKVTSFQKAFTWCTYEHRNSDEIIINGKEGYITSNGELPYKSDSKFSYLASFSFDQYQEAADYLADEIVSFVKNNSSQNE